MSTIKPLNHEFMKKLCSEYANIVVFEDHTIYGGAGSAICEWVAQYSSKPVKVHCYGVKDVFGESGTPEALYQKHGFTPSQIASFSNSLSTLQ